MAPEISDPEMMELQGEVGYLDQITVDRQYLNQPVCPLKICQIYLAIAESNAEFSSAEKIQIFIFYADFFVTVDWSCFRL